MENFQGTETLVNFEFAPLDRTLRVQVSDAAIISTHLLVRQRALVATVDASWALGNSARARRTLMTQG